MVVYRATPADVAIGRARRRCRVSRLSGVGRRRVRREPGDHAAFFALLHDQQLNTPIVAFARDEAGNEAQGALRRQRLPQAVQEEPDRARRPIHRPRRARDPRAFAGAEDGAAGDGGDMIAGVRRGSTASCAASNADEIAAFAEKTSPTQLWDGPFVQLGNSQVEAAFADHRTYLYKGKEVDQQVHLGFDLAVTAPVPVVAANAGTVLNASWLGIYGNCVIIDHGMGVQSLYGHLSSFDVKVGDTRHARADDRTQRHDRAGRRRSSAFHDAGRRPHGEPGRMVGSALDCGPRRAKAREAARLSQQPVRRD